MKILLVGEYSAVHKYLKEGLEELGHQVTTISSGDGWKNISTDIHLHTENYGFGKLGTLYSFFRQWLIMKKLRNFDVVQLVNPYMFTLKYGINKLFINTLIRNNKKTFLLNAGDDALYWKDYKKRFRYSPHEDFMKYDMKYEKYVWQDRDLIKWNYELINKVSGVIPIMYEYIFDHPKVRKPIPIPINLKSIKYQENVVKDKVVFFHGLNREGFKGTKYIKAAMERLKHDYSDEVEVIIDGKMPYVEYLKIMEKVNVNIDQALSYSYGVNGVISLAMGKITMSGCEKECLSVFGLESSEVINILPNTDDIYEKMVYILKNKESILEAGKRSREYCEELHDCVKVASKFLDEWQS